MHIKKNTLGKKKTPKLAYLNILTTITSSLKKA